MQDRFWEKVKKTPGCWLWTSATWGSGYGFFWVGGRKRSEFAHRLSWSWANNAAIPAGMVVMHSCDNKLCVNPAHLSLGTHADNKADSVRKKRHATGERNGGGRKLTRAQADEIKTQRGAVGSTTLGRKHGVGKSTVLSIWKGRIWQ